MLFLYVMNATFTRNRFIATKQGVLKMNKNDIAIGKRIRVLRKAANITQSELARLLEISPQQLQKYERGINKVSAGRVQRIAEIVRSPIASFFPSLDGDIEQLNEMFDDTSLVRLMCAYNAIASKKLRELLVFSARVFVEEAGRKRKTK